MSGRARPDVDGVIARLTTMAEGLSKGVADGVDSNRPLVRLPGWASICRDAIDTIEELAEIRRLRSEVRVLKTTVRSQLAQLAQLAHARRVNRALQLEREG